MATTDVTNDNSKPYARERLSKDLARAMFHLSAWACLGIVGAATFSFGSATGVSQFFSILASSVLLALASGSIGGLIGFLFGVPRTLQGNTTDDTAEAYRQKVNTNLEQISDWLTKILVGASLVEFNAILGKLSSIGTDYQQYLGNSQLLVIAIIINYSVWGFFCGYIFTRMFLAGAFAIADQEAELRTKLKHAEIAVQERTTELTEQSRNVYPHLEEYINSITAETPKDEKRKAFEGIIFNSLYLKEPEGFQKAILYATRFIGEEGEETSFLISAYLAAAYGQEYGYGKATAMGPESLKISRDNALKAASTAIRLDPKLKTLLQYIWDPSFSGKYVGSGDNDLEVFYGDADFKRLLGA